MHSICMYVTSIQSVVNELLLLSDVWLNEFSFLSLLNWDNAIWKENSNYVQLTMEMHMFIYVYMCICIYYVTATRNDL